MFPNYSIQQITLDLQESGSMQSTIDNIINNRLIPENRLQPQHTRVESKTKSFAEVYSVAPVDEPERKFLGSKDDREVLLKQRKAWMLKMQREKFLKMQGKDL